MRSALRILLVTLMTLSWAGCARVNHESSTEAPSLDAQNPAQFAAAILSETNRVRVQFRLRPLKSLPDLDLAADDQASYMALQLNADHGNAFFGEATPEDRVRRRGLLPKSVAENVASIAVAPTAKPRTTSEIAAALVEAWMNSPGHRANLLNPHFTHLGASARIAHATGAWYAFGAQDFVELADRAFP